MLLMEETNAAITQQELLSNPEYVNIENLFGIEIDLRYATCRNFLGVNLYGDFCRPILRKTAAEKLQLAAQSLHEMSAGYKLLILDAARPHAVQYRLWDFVKGTPMECYVAHPDAGSVHNFGFAVDLTIVDERNTELDMGTDFDAFDELSQPMLEERFWQEGLLTQFHIKNRGLLRRVMHDAGFIQNPLEWWHFDAIPAEDAKKYPIIE